MDLWPLPAIVGRALAGESPRSADIRGALFEPYPGDEGQPVVYRIKRLIGEGSMANVYLAEHRHLKRIVVLVRILRQVCAAVGAMHARQLLHREVKPDNVIAYAARNRRLAAQV